MERRYGQWAGQLNGRREDITRCVVEIFPRDAYISRQCRRLKGYGPEGEYCKQHAKRFEDDNHHG
jgi:hypothetical protein